MTYRPGGAAVAGGNLSSMIFTRLGYLVIIAIMGAAAVAIAIVVLRDSDSAAEAEEVPFQKVVDYALYGTILRIEADGDELTAYVREDVDVSPVGVKGHVWQSTVPDGRDVETALREAGIAVNGEGGLPVTQR
jgi:hypothetical protein